MTHRFDKASPIPCNEHSANMPRASQYFVKVLPGACKDNAKSNPPGTPLRACRKPSMARPQAVFVFTPEASSWSSVLACGSNSTCTSELLLSPPHLPRAGRQLVNILGVPGSSSGHLWVLLVIACVLATQVAQILASIGHVLPMLGQLLALGNFGATVGQMRSSARILQASERHRWHMARRFHSPGHNDTCDASRRLCALCANTGGADRESRYGGMQEAGTKRCLPRRPVTVLGRSVTRILRLRGRLQSRLVIGGCSAVLCGYACMSATPLQHVCRYSRFSAVKLTAKPFVGTPVGGNANNAAPFSDACRHYTGSGLPVPSVFRGKAQANSTRSGYRPTCKQGNGAPCRQRRGRKAWVCERARVCTQMLGGWREQAQSEVAYNGSLFMCATSCAILLAVSPHMIQTTVTSCRPGLWAHRLPDQCL